MENGLTVYAIITGAASGMGRCYALQLAEKGYGTVLVDINGKGARELSELISSKYHVPAPVIQVDLTEPNAAQQIVSKCHKESWRVEVLINNAGMLIVAPIEETSPDQLRRIIALHQTTPLLLCRMLVPHMKNWGKGYILNVSSITAWMDWPVIGIYGSTKRFVKSYTRQLRIESKGTPVSVTTAIFGAVDTPLLSKLPDGRWRETMKKYGILISPEKATRLALGAMFKRKATLIPTLPDRAIILLSPLVPSWLLRLLWDKYRRRQGTAPAEQKE